MKAKSKNPPHLNPLPQGGEEGKARSADEFKLIPRSEVHPDPEQPRKTFDPAALQALADSIREQGIVQPLLVRLVKAKFRICEPDLHCKEYRVEERFPDGFWMRAFGDVSREKCVHFTGEQNLVDRYVIIAGERRWRAAEIAGLATVPCIVRDVDEQRKFALQFIENSQRENVSALEEAEALAREIEVRRMSPNGFSVEDLARELGMSRAGLYGRLVLTRLHPPVREALVSGKISTSVAQEVAKLPTPDAQQLLLKEITNENAWNFPFSVRDVQKLVTEKYCRQLDDAAFDVAKTYGSAGDCLTPCKGCPNRSGNMVEQFPDLAKRPNICTQPDCYAAKLKAHWLEQTASAKANGQTVLTETEFRKVKATLVRRDAYASALFDCNGAYDKTVSDALGKHAPTPVIVATEDGLEEYFKRDDITAAAKKAKLKIYAERKPETAEQKAKREAEEKAAADLYDRRCVYVADQCEALLKALKKLSDTKSWQLARLLSEGANGYTDESLSPLLACVDQKDPRLAVLTKLFADEENHPVNRDGWQDTAVDAWIIAGIDLVDGFEKAEKAAQPTLPAKKSATQEDLMTVKPNKPPTHKAMAGQGKKGTK